MSLVFVLIISIVWFVDRAEYDKQAELEQLSLAEGELVIVSRREKNISIKILIVDDESHYGNQIYAN
jgi:hypothetical protein